MNNNEFSISVIVPAHNDEAFIGECLDSILGQSLRPKEIIICDDNSMDATRKIIADYRSRFPELIHAILHDTPMGCAANFNSGIHAARGKYVSIVAADDYWLPEKLEREVAKISKTGCRWAYSAVEVRWQEGHDAGRQAPFWGTVDGRSGAVFDDILLRRLSPRNFLIEYDILHQAGGFDEALGMYEDWDLKLRLSDSYPIAFVPEVGIIYRQHEKGISRADAERQLAEAGKVLRKNAGIVSRHSSDDSRVLQEAAFRHLLPSNGMETVHGSKQVPAWLAMPYVPRRLTRRGDGLIFFIGYPQSGALRLVAEHPDILCVESDCPARQVLQDFANMAESDTGTAAGVRSFVHAYYQKRLVTSGRSRVLQPCVAGHERLEFLQQLFPDARFLCDPIQYLDVATDPCIRDGRMMVMYESRMVFEFLDLPPWFPEGEPQEGNQMTAEDAVMLIAEGESCFANGDLSAAERLFRRALAVDGNALDAHNNLAVILWQQGDVASALKCLADVLAREPVHRESLQNTIRILHTLGEVEECEALLDRYIAVYPGDEEMRAMMDAAR
ncbi:MAG: glycosyltransferase [Thiogranum sp.]|nr:glycosyltransferase [Thiogranum sp.]